jgi:hypothetical protein
MMITELKPFHDLLKKSKWFRECERYRTTFRWMKISMVNWKSPVTHKSKFMYFETALLCRLKCCLGINESPRFICCSDLIVRIQALDLMKTSLENIQRQALLIFWAVPSSKDPLEITGEAFIFNFWMMIHPRWLRKALANSCGL